MPYAIRSTQYAAVSGTTAQFTSAMQPGQTYMFTCNTDCWIRVAATGTAAVANTANNILYIKGQVLFLANPDSSGTTNSFVNVIQDSASGDACLSLVESA